MAKNTKGLKKGGSKGRKKGVPNKATVEIREASRTFLEDEQGRAKMLSQYRAGKLSPPVVVMLHHYAYGKPKDTIEVTGQNGAPIQAITRLIVDPKAGE